MDFRIVALFLTLVAVGLVNGKQSFTYTVKNELEPPFILETIELNIYNRRNLYSYMVDACRQDSDRFTNFTVMFQPADGFIIKAINGVSENWNHQTYWQISNAAGVIGVRVVSNYIPEADDKIEIELIQAPE